ncbi:hypothetical protein PS2_006710 [Malus domestica]
MNQSTFSGKTTLKFLVAAWYLEIVKTPVLEYNEYAVYSPKQVSIRFLVAVKYEEGLSDGAGGVKGGWK